LYEQGGQPELLKYSNFQLLHMEVNFNTNITTSSASASVFFFLLVFGVGGVGL